MRGLAFTLPKMTAWWTTNGWDGAFPPGSVPLLLLCLSYQHPTLVEWSSRTAPISPQGCLVKTFVPALPPTHVLSLFLKLRLWRVLGRTAVLAPESVKKGLRDSFLVGKRLGVRQYLLEPFAHQLYHVRDRSFVMAPSSCFMNTIYSPIIWGYCCYFFQGKKDVQFSDIMLNQRIQIPMSIYDFILYI